MSISVPSALGQAPANPPKQKYWTVRSRQLGCADGDIIDISVGRRSAGSQQMGGPADRLPTAIVNHSASPSGAAPSFFLRTKE